MTSEDFSSKEKEGEHDFVNSSRGSRDIESVVRLFSTKPSAPDDILLTAELVCFSIMSELK